VLRSTASGQLQSQHDNKQKQHVTTQDKKQISKQKTIKNKTHRKSDQLKMFMFQLEFIQTSVDLQAAFEAETHRAEGQ
jgi:hypothetical protein